MSLDNSLFDNEYSEDKTIKMIDFIDETNDDIDAFDKEAWAKGDGFVFPSYPIFTEKTEGMDDGLYLFAGLSNHGKSGVLLNLMEDCCSCEKNNAFGLYFSLDDSKNEIIARIIAMNELIPIGIVSKPKRYQNKITKADNDINYYNENSAAIESYRTNLEKRKQGLQNLKNKKDSFKVVDSAKINNIEDMYNYIKTIITYLQSKNINKKLIIGIDSINDINWGKRITDKEDPIAKVSKEVKKWTVEFKCPILASCHIRKLNSNRRPVLDDLKDSTVIVYEASVSFILYNDVSANGNSAKICQQRIDSEVKEPIIEMHWAKNKKSSFKGRTFMFFSPDYSKTSECNANDMTRYSALIYET